MSREAFGDPPESQEPPDLCPVCGNDWHAEDCEFGKEVARRLKAERDAHRMQFALHRLWPALERAMAGLVFTADRAGQVQEDMNTLREYSNTSRPDQSKCDEPCVRGCKPWECRAGWPDAPMLKPDIAALKARMAADPEFAAQVTGDRPPTPVGWSDTDWLKHLEEIRQDQETYHRGPLPETGVGLMTLQDRIDELVAQHGSLRAVARVTEIDAGYLSRLRAYANVNPGRDKLRRLGLRRVVTYELLKTPNAAGKAPAAPADGRP